MKRTFFLIAFLLLICSNVTFAQENLYDENTERLKRFYTAQTILWKKFSLLSPEEFNFKNDSIQALYCSRQIISEAKEWMEDAGRDLYTNDNDMDLESLETMQINKDTLNENAYLIKYLVQTFPNSEQFPVTIGITLQVGLVKEDGIFKIEYVFER